ncbi:MAG: acyl-CoA dehydrogenase family protein [Steroidobacteraceae bacterium]
MNLDYSDSDKEMKAELRRILQKACPLTRVRKVLDGDANESRRVTAELGEMGWLSAALPEAYGGQGLSYVALCGIAEELGRALAPTSYGSTVFLLAETLLVAGTEAQKQSLLRALGSGKRIGTLALVEGAGPIAPEQVSCTWGAGKLQGEKMAVADGLDADLAIVSAKSDSNVQLFLADLTHPTVTRTAQKSMDPTRPLARLTFRDAPAQPLGDGADWSVLARVLDRAAVLFAFEQVGGADAALEMGRDYALSRYAFGRPIGSFQAIKHKLADVYIANELARSNAYYAAWALSKGAPELPLAAATARVAACEAFERAARENMQVHGGVSATWAHDCHLFYRRARHLGSCIGTVNQWRNQAARLLIAQHAA